MKKFVSFLLLFFSISHGFSQKNYIIPEPQNISFPESKQHGFRLSKKTSLEILGIDNSKGFVEKLYIFCESRNWI